MKIVGVVYPTKVKTKLACILDADESKRMRTGEPLPNHHEDHVAGKGGKFTAALQFRSQKFIPMPQAENISAAKAAVDKEWEKLEKISAWNLTKVKSKKDVIDESTDEGCKSSFCIIDGHMSSEKC